MANDLEWLIEEIPDEDLVYMRAHRMFFRGRVLLPGVFRQQEDGMSVDWEKYASADDTRRRGANPSDNAVLRLPVLGVRDINKLDVKHTPVPSNRAHSDVIGLPPGGEDLTEARMLLLGISRIVLDLSADDG